MISTDFLSANPIQGKIDLNTFSNNPRDLQSEFSNMLQMKIDGDAAREKKLDRLKEASYDLQSLLVNTMMKTMRSTIEKGDLFNGGFAEEVFESMLDEEYSKTISQTGNLGLAELIFDQLKGSL